MELQLAETFQLFINVTRYAVCSFDAGQEWDNKKHRRKSYELELNDTPVRLN